MDKIAFYKEQIYKTAARAWKAHLGDIGEEGIERLVSSGILNREKELQGLKKGTENIVKHYGGTIDTTRSGKYLKKQIKNSVGTMDVGGKVMNDLLDGFDSKTPETIKEKITQGGVKTLNNIGTKAINKVNYAATNFMRSGNKNFVTVPNADNTMGGVIGAGNAFKRRGPLTGLLLGKNDPFKPMGKTVKSKFDRDYLNAVFTRHEANELRAANKAIKQNRFTELIDGVKVPGDNRVYSHLDPEVLLRESADVAVAPKSVQDTIKNLRSDKNIADVMGEYGDTEIEFLKRRYNLDYGKSGVYKKLKPREDTYAEKMERLRELGKGMGIEL